KPRKYHGPIPKRYFTFSVGFFGGADNDEMWSFLERQVDEVLRKEATTDDFGAAPSVTLAYSAKLHPQFAVRVQGGLTILTSQSRGLMIPQAEPDSTGQLPLLEFDRDFDVLLMGVDATGFYYFQDASVKNFQSYLGGGFSLFFPRSEFKQSLTDKDTMEGYPPGRGTTSQTDWSVSPGVHAVLGFLYHFKTTLAFNGEGRIQIAQSKFKLDYETENGIQPLTFDVDYTGFSFTVGISKFF
ncbi:MAG: hypothetical protein P8181_01820, partial [bacterium]